MVSETEQSLERHLLDILGVKLEKHPSADADRGFITLEGRSDAVIKITVEITKLGAYPPPRQQSIEGQLKKYLPAGDNSLDLDIPGENETTKMIRLISHATKDTLEISFGGGGNYQTKYSEMDAAITAAIQNALSVIGNS